MDESCFILGVDLDGVVGDFYSSIRKIAAEWLNKQESELTVNVSYDLEEWGIAEYGGYERLHRFAVTQRHLFRDMRPMQDAPVVLRKLSSQGVRIRIITHRLYLKYIHKESVIQTVDWLDFWDIPYWDICFMKDKGAVGAHIYVDDAPENIVNLRKQNCKTIVFTNSTNHSLPAPRADSWVDVERLVMEAKAEWEESAGP
ncbi:MAG: 5'-nucleotidase [Treponema sp.]|nr:5'-nucleotidase [Treponema sp.]